jgi:excinuclease UvrABC nuclease subunit
VGSEQKKEENRLVKRAGRRREQGREASNSIQRTEKRSEQEQSENTAFERAERIREQYFIASKVIQRTDWKSEQRGIENRTIFSYAFLLDQTR